jgi:hypothetical protein
MYRVFDVWCDLVFDFDVYRIHVSINVDLVETTISVYNYKNDKWECEDCSLENPKEVEECVRELY